MIPGYILQAVQISCDKNRCGYLSTTYYTVGVNSGNLTMSGTLPFVFVKETLDFSQTNFLRK